MSDAPASTTPLTVRAIDTAETYPLRHSVLRPDGPLSDVEFPGDDDALTIHAGAIDERGAIVGIASMYHEPRPSDAPGGAPCPSDHDANTAWRLRGMATDPAARRRGAGTRALELCTQHARENGATLLWCNARIEAIEFYIAQGWEVLGEEFDIPTVGPHYVMERRLA